MKFTAYSITGIIFPEGYQYIGISTQLSLKTVAIVNELMKFKNFNGVVCQQYENPQHLVGVMNDHWGDSSIQKFIISEHEVSFEKTYRKHLGLRIECFLKKNLNGIWEGEFKGPNRQIAYCNALISKIDEAFFYMQQINPSQHLLAS